MIPYGIPGDREQDCGIKRHTRSGMKPNACAPKQKSCGWIRHFAVDYKNLERKIARTIADSPTGGRIATRPDLILGNLAVNHEIAEPPEGLAVKNRPVEGTGQTVG